MMRIACVMLLLALRAAGAAGAVQGFDADPRWEGKGNRVVPATRPTVTQDFGYAPDGRVGGTVTRASEPAFYGDRIGARTLDEKLRASGSFAISKTSPGAGFFFGFFNASQPGASGRPIGSLGMDFDCEHTGARLAVRLISADNQSCGTFVTPFIPGKFRPTTIRNDGTIYHWAIDYDPDAAGGRGRFTFTLRSDAHKPGELETPDMTDAARAEARARFPNTTSFAVELPEGFKRLGTTFDHFGMMNMMKTGGSATVHFDDVAYLDRRQDFARDPGWEASGNRATYQAKDVDGAHDFGFRPASHHAGGNAAGEIGGTFWRTDRWAYYADKVTPLTLDDRLEAHGRVALLVGGPDSEMCFGWFRSRADDDASTGAPHQAGDFLGIKIGGPTRVGHYFLPRWCASERLRGKVEKGPVMRPGKPAEWSIVYDPSANGGDGAVTATLDGESVTLNLKPGQKAAAKDARFDRFGMFSIGPGGQIVKVFLDDITYTGGADR